MYPEKVKIESMEEYSEAKIYKSKPELKRYVNADYLYSSVTWCLFTINHG